ncbi:NnrU family protein [Pseudooctadecabacter jejudonensis]|uniref:NnrU protein n=1 Tax=Pseudooctadecabacter jejudonensis TaxID=1391910 RepID=A0A1Y5RZX3_9RHOB|nr:NnrU family protein [Pseudooctadecabacter jejudonensis]SLN26463.1 NnrU protein [Pseudooctadecabacter jejudonensis]
MTLILLGLALWAGAHFWKRVAPAHRATFGDTGKGIVAGASVLAIVLMVLGYRLADGAVYWGRGNGLMWLNNLAMVLAFYLFAASGKGTRVTRMVRHPQLTAVVVWAVAHLLVNGDTASFVLFGGMGLWALAEMVLINRAQGPRGAYHAPPLKSEVISVVATLVVTVIVMLIHHWLGVTPWG